MLLSGKNSVVYGAGGAVGSAVARAFSREGAKVFLAGRTGDALEKVADEITNAGGTAEIAVVDALDENQIEGHLGAIVRQDIRLDVVFNAITYGDQQGTELVRMSLEDLAFCPFNAIRTHFLTTRVAARNMIDAGGGVILTVTGHGQPFPKAGGTTLAWDATESLYRQWACELGPKGVRVAWIRTGGFTEPILESETLSDSFADGTRPEELLASLEDETMLNRLPSLHEAGDAAAFLASDRAKSVTATAINITAGSMAD